MSTYGFCGPRDLPALRDEALGYAKDPALGPVTHQAILDQGMVLVHPFGNDHRRGAEWIASTEARCLRLAELYYVTPAMTQLAMAAAESLPDFDIEREDLPSDAGLVVFGEPVYVVVDDGDPRAPREDVPIAAVAWGILPNSPTAWRFGGIWLTFYADLTRSQHRDQVKQQLRAGGHDVGRFLPRLAFNDVGGWPFTGDGLHLDREDRPDLMSKVGPVLKSTWLLMQQPIASVSLAAPDRADRRRAERAGEIAQPVRVISLRVASSQNHGEQGSREYHHRWVVRGHWRNQWMPGRKVHRPIWIHAHIKGPDEAPLLTGEKVYAWRR